MALGIQYETYDVGLEGGDPIVHFPIRGVDPAVIEEQNVNDDIFRLMDTNRDDQVSLDELLHGFGLPVRDEGARSKLQRAIDSHADASTGDGHLDLGSFRRLLDHISSTAAMGAGQHFDLDALFAGNGEAGNNDRNQCPSSGMRDNAPNSESICSFNA